MKSLCLILFYSSIVLYSCEPHYKYQTPAFPDTPVNLENINSEFDDYNSTSPVLGGTGPLCFSSNRNSKGKEFNIIYKLLDIIMFKSNGLFSVGENRSTNLDVYAQHANLNNAVSAINTGFDELGPYLIPQGSRTKKVGNGYQPFQHYILLYASNESGNLDIKFTHNLINDSYSIPENIIFLNSTKNDAYPTISSDSSTFYFCSDRQDNFDIYKVALLKKGNMVSALSDITVRTTTKDIILSSDSDDKCPFIVGNLMVFSSNRAGGYGGFDLYYSIYKEAKWSAPINFGDKVNSPFDDYRPIVKVYEYEFTNDFMLFSSNRPGGKGGFDLYYVGIDKMSK